MSTPAAAASSSSGPAAGSPWNFNAGPGVLPASVLSEAARNLEQYGGPFPAGTGLSVMCMSHRSAAFESIIASAIQNCRDLLKVPDTHTILFMHGGGTGAFAAAPLNLTTSPSDIVSHVVSGAWSAAAAREAEKFCKVEIIADSKNENGKYTNAPDAKTWAAASKDSKYIHFCANETQHGIAAPELPDRSVTDSMPPIVADYSSCFMGAPIDISRFGVVYAGAQKNVGPSGVTIYIIRKSLLDGAANKICPSILDWRLFAKSGSMYNTPCTWSIYMMNLVFEWIKSNGGVEGMAEAAKRKSDLIYRAIDQSGGFYQTFVQGDARSRHNICFFISASKDGTPSAALQNSFVSESESAGFVGLAGHRSVGALRASIYNGMPEEGCIALVQFMEQFQRKQQQQANQ